MRHHYIASALAISALFIVGVVTTIHAANTGILVPIADGTYQQWTRSGGTGSSHFTRVDEIPCNGSLDYVYVRTVGFRDSFEINLSSIPNGQVISSITITPCAGYMTLGASTTRPIMNLFYRWNGTNSGDAGNYTVPTITPTTLTPTQFTGLSLTKDISSRLEIGAVYTRPAIPSGIAGVKLSNINVVLTYASSSTSTTPILPPSNLTATSTASTTPLIRLNWQDNSTNETHFFIRRGPDPLTMGYYTSVPANITSYNDFGVIRGTTYYYCVYAHNATSDSVCSNTAVATAR